MRLDRVLFMLLTRPTTQAFFVQLSSLTTMRFAAGCHTNFEVAAAATIRGVRRFKAAGKNSTPCGSVS